LKIAYEKEVRRFHDELKAVIKIGFLCEMFSFSNATIDSWNKQVFLLSVCTS
jgi:hypothetical protein